MLYSELPDRAISIMQPWTWLIVNGHKDIENRDWQTRFRGPVAIHAGKRKDHGTISDLWAGIHPVTGESTKLPSGMLSLWPRAPDDEFAASGIVGVAEIVDCVDNSASPWFVGRYGFVLKNARPVPFIPCKGALSFFAWKDRLL